MGYPQLFYNNPDQLSAWIFPPAVDVQFLGRWKELYFQNNHTNNKHDHYFQLEAVKNTTAPPIGRFGHERNIVHVGDAIEVEWNTRGEERSVTLKCIVCSLGQGSDGVFDACASYSNTQHLSEAIDVTPVLPNPILYILPDLSKSIDLPDESVGICNLILSDRGGGVTWDNSVPFPVAQERRAWSPPYRFRKNVPGGYPDATLLEASQTGAPEKGDGGGGLNTGAIVGTVLGVILGICLSAIVGWFVWRRERRKLKKSSEGREEGGDADTELRGMQQRGGGVVRQAEADEDGEVPPAYHEVVKDSRDIHV